MFVSLLLGVTQTPLRMADAAGLALVRLFRMPVIWLCNPPLGFEIFVYPPEGALYYCKYESKL